MNKIKAKKFVKIYAQISSILSINQIEWEQLYWFLKFLIPKLDVQDQQTTGIDELLEQVDLTTYALKCEHLNTSIVLDAGETVVDPQNPNPRSPSSGRDEATLDQILSKFNEKWFQGWSATPEDQKVMVIYLVKSIQSHPHFENKYKNNPDPYTRSLAFEKILNEIMVTQRRNIMELYKLYQKDDAFKGAFSQTLENLVQ